MLQGTYDTLIFVQEARAFVSKPRGVSKAPLAYAEQVGAQHAYDAVHRFLEVVYSGYLRQGR